jgi:hypothetical protein
MTVRLVGLVLLIALIPATADARRVTLRIRPVDENSDGTGSWLEERVRVSLPDQGRVGRDYRGRIWSSGRCRIHLVAQAHAVRRRSLERTGEFVRFRLPDRHAEQRVVYVLVTPLRCAPGAADPILRSAALDSDVPGCGVGGTTILANDRLRVYRIRDWMKACFRSTRHRFDLGFVRDSSNCYVAGCFVDHPVLAGSRVAYADEYGGRDGSSSYVLLRDGRTGRTLRKVQAGSTCPGDSRYQAGPVRSLELGLDGAMTWTVDACPGAAEPTETHSLGPLR